MKQREIIKLIVTVEITYSNKTERKEAIKRTKQCLTSTSVLGSNSIYPLKAVLGKINKTTVMNTYEITLETTEGEIVLEVIQADSIKEAKRICKEYYSVKKFL